MLGISRAPPLLRLVEVWPSFTTPCGRAFGGAGSRPLRSGALSVCSWRPCSESRAPDWAGPMTSISTAFRQAAGKPFPSAILQALGRNFRATAVTSLKEARVASRPQYWEAAWERQPRPFLGSE